MNVNRVRSLLLLVNIGLAGGTGYTVYHEFDTKKVRTQQTTDFYDKLTKDVTAAPKAVRTTSVRVSIKDSDLVDFTGDKPKVAEIESRPASAPTSVRTPVEDMIKLVTISVHPDRSLSRVALSRKTGTDLPSERLIFGEGDAIPFANDAVVVEVRSKEVVFQNGDKLETVKISEIPAVAAGGPSGGSSRPADTGARPFSTYIESKKDSGTVTIKSGGALALDREGETVLQGVIWSTTEDKDGKKALRVDKVPPNSVLAQHGLQDGDVLVSVNGQAMSSKSEVVDYVKSHKSTYLFEVVIQRRGGLVHKTVQVER
jgi:hypothetical protein